MASSTLHCLLWSLALVVWLGASVQADSKQPDDADPMSGPSVQAGSKRADDADPMALVVDRLAQDLASLQAQVTSQNNQLDAQRQQIDAQTQEIADLKAVNNRTVAFSAYMSDMPTVHAAKGTTAPFRGIIANPGGAYNPHTSVFTAPFAGHYFFSIHADCSHDFHALLVTVNGHSIFIAANDGNDYHVTGSGLMTLQSGDVVTAQFFTDTGLLDSGRESTFTGFLVK